MAGSVVIVLLAAGEGRRFGSVKQLADVDGEPMVRRSARRAIDSGAPVIVVTGADAERVEDALTGLAVHVVRHAAWAEGMGSSIAAGIRELRRHFPHATGALLCLADQPMIEQALFEAMLTRHRVAGDRVLASEHDDVMGPPVLFPRDCFEALVDWSGARGAHALLEHESARVERFSSHGSIDVDTPDDLQRVRAAIGSTSRETSV
ncbi:nucleotidyltransferase family protein [Pinirhizobacter soli]|uniref:nucleotidyltransferase family protein n=1 Tax=Pinirhizobacter soli TaxID=2786953 RepID=UPI00202A705C|nr:nucleotidyltransferase family protein [Pinirhizobacter soli]